MPTAGQNAIADRNLLLAKSATPPPSQDRRPFARGQTAKTSVGECHRGSTGSGEGLSRHLERLGVESSLADEAAGRGTGRLVRFCTRLFDLESFAHLDGASAGDFGISAEASLAPERSEIQPMALN
jgi:hypothetical protein